MILQLSLYSGQLYICRSYSIAKHLLVKGYFFYRVAFKLCIWIWSFIWILQPTVFLLKYFAFFSSKSEMIQIDETECYLMFRMINAWRRDWSTVRQMSLENQSAATPMRRCPIRCLLSAHRLARMGVWGWGDSAGKLLFYHLVTCRSEFTGEWIYFAEQYKCRN